MTDAQYRARKKYAAKGKRLQIDLCPSEQDLIDFLETKKPLATYIKDLIRQDMRK